MNYKVYSVYIPSKKARLKYFASKKRAVAAAKLWCDKSPLLRVVVEEYNIDNIYSDDDLINSLNILFNDIQMEIADKNIVFWSGGIE